MSAFVKVAPAALVLLAGTTGQAFSIEASYTCTGGIASKPAFPSPAFRPQAWC